MVASTISGSYEYTPFGEPIRVTGSAAKENPFRFSTRYCDDESGLLGYPKRPYALSQGRFLCKDPAGEKGGRNLYALAGNSLGVDPLGLVELHYIDHPKWEPFQIFRSGEASLQEYLWVGHYLTFDAADSTALGGSGALVLKYTASARITGCGTTSTVTPESDEWYVVTPFTLWQDGTLRHNPLTYYSEFTDGQAHLFSQIANISFAKAFRHYGGMPSGMGFTSGEFSAHLEWRVLSLRDYSMSQDDWQDPGDLGGFDDSSIQGHELSGWYSGYMVNQVPEAWTTSNYRKVPISVHFKWNDCACSSYQNTWDYDPDPALASPGADRVSDVGHYWTAIDLIKRPHTSN